MGIGFPRSCSSHNSNSRKSLMGNAIGTRKRVWATPRATQDGEATQGEMIGKLLHIDRPIQNPLIGIECSETVAIAVWGN